MVFRYPVRRREITMVEDGVRRDLRALLKRKAGSNEPWAPFVSYDDGIRQWQVLWARRCSWCRASAQQRTA